jgi:2-alkyl-3-oxoalkanoate reductase
MRIFLAGATGVVGRQLVPALRQAGHEVVGTTRSIAKAAELAAAGAEPVVLDALDRDAVHDAVGAARPDVVIHQLTAITRTDFKDLDKAFTQTNRLRTEGLDHLLDAARAAGAKRFVAQSFTGWPNARTGGPVKTEDDPLDTQPARNSERTLAAIRHLEAATTRADGMDGIVVRFGLLYGSGTALEPGGEMLEMIKKRKLPVVGGGAGVFSFTHVQDAAGGTVAAVERGRTGIYNIVDDEPAPVATWLPYLADLLRTKPPQKLPGWLVKPMLGELGVNIMTVGRGSSNAKAKRELGWTLTYPTWREGFRTFVPKPR